MSEFIDYVRDQLSGLRALSHRSFFGGRALLSDGIQFAMVMRGTLYFVVNDDTRAQYERMGSQCFSYETREGRHEIRRYFEVPADIIEDHERLLMLARDALAVAMLKPPKAKPKAKPKAESKTESKAEPKTKPKIAPKSKPKTTSSPKNKPAKAPPKPRSPRKQTAT